MWIPIADWLDLVGPEGCSGKLTAYVDSLDLKGYPNTVQLHAHLEVAVTHWVKDRIMAGDIRVPLPRIEVRLGDDPRVVLIGVVAMD